jgi:hypothetical protein
MKSILMLAVLASTPAMALTIGDGRTEPSVRYLSWCDANSVISEDGQGQLYVKAVCKQNEECRLTERPFGQGSTISATCVLKK